MEVFDALDAQMAFPKTSVALGYFDGIHLGHQAVIRTAQKSPYETAIFTFTKDEKSVETGKNDKNLISMDEKKRLCAEMGVSYFVAPSFAEIADLSPEAFVRDILYQKMGAKVLTCGENFRFGKAAKGDTGLLRELCEELGILLHIAPPVFYEGEMISTTRIKSRLEHGEVDGVNAMLGRLISYESEVVHGEKLGRKLGFPTMNQFFSPEVEIPSFGIYATVVEIDGVRHLGVSSIGVKPTIKGVHPPNIETYLPDFSGDLYGKQVRVGLYKYLRGEKKFASLEELKKQMGRDTDKSKELLGDAQIRALEL